MINAASARTLSFRSLTAAAAPVPPKPQPDPEPFQVGSRPAFGLSKLQQRLIDEDPIELRKGGKFAGQLVPPEDELMNVAGKVAARLVPEEEIQGRHGIAEQMMEPPPEEEMGRKLNLGSEAAFSPEDELMHGGRIAEVPPEDEMIRNFEGDLRPAEFQPVFDEDDRRPQVNAAVAQVVNALQISTQMRQLAIR